MQNQEVIGLLMFHVVLSCPLSNFASESDKYIGQWLFMQILIVMTYFQKKKKDFIDFWVVFSCHDTLNFHYLQTDVKTLLHDKWMNIRIIVPTQLNFFVILNTLLYSLRYFFFSPYVILFWVLNEMARSIKLHWHANKSMFL